MNRLAVVVSLLACSAYLFATDKTGAKSPAPSSVTSATKLIALTFDDGPRPYVLYGEGPAQASGGLLDVLQKNAAPATFFYMGWRLTPKTFGDRR